MSIQACSYQKTDQEREDAGKKIQTAKINAQLGLAYLERNDVERAKRKLLVALDQAPNIPESWYSMAYFLEATGNKIEAKKYYLKAMEISPLRGDVRNNYGTFLCRSGQYEAAIKQFVSAAENPQYVNSAGAYENAGLCSMKMADEKGAYAYFQKSIMQDPSRPVSLIELATLDYKKGNYVQAKSELDQYLLIASPNVQSSKLSAKLSSKLREKLSDTEFL